MQVDGLTATVTGGASGVGGATTAMLVSGGATVAILDLNEQMGAAHAEVFDHDKIHVGIFKHQRWARRALSRERGVFSR